MRALPGIGEWTAQYIAMRELREPDAFPAADVGLLRAMADASGRRPSPAELLARAEALAAMARLCGAASVGRGAAACRRVRRTRPMRAKPPETFSIDRLETPIGPALLVTDADGVLRAFDWEDHAERIKELLRLQYGAVDLQGGACPEGDQVGADRLFQGRSRRAEDDRMAHCRHAVPAQGLERAAEDSRRARP